jgi:hypothetical protein
LKLSTEIISSRLYISLTESLSCRSRYVAFPEQITALMADEMLMVETNFAGRETSSR